MTCEGESPVRLEELLAGKSYPSRFEQKTPIGFFTLAFLYAIPIPFFNKSERERERERERELSSSENGDDNRRYKFPRTRRSRAQLLNSTTFMVSIFFVLKIELEIRVLAADNIWDYGG